MRPQLLIQPAGHVNAIDTKGADYVAQQPKGPESLTKVIPIIGVILMALHIIWPLNLPGLRKRRDFWKIAVVMGVAIFLFMKKNKWM